MPRVPTDMQVNDNKLIDGDHISFLIHGHPRFTEMVKVNRDAMVKLEVKRGLNSSMRYSGFEDKDLQAIWDVLDAHLLKIKPWSPKMKTIAEVLKEICAKEEKNVCDVMESREIKATAVHQYWDKGITEYVFCDESSLTVKGNELTAKASDFEEYCDSVEEFFELLEEFTQMKVHTIVDTTKLSCTATLAIMQCMDENAIARKDAINICNLLDKALTNRRPEKSMAILVKEKCLLIDKAKLESEAIKAGAELDFQQKGTTYNFKDGSSIFRSANNDCIFK